MMNIQEYKAKRIGTGVQETEDFGYQCVAQAKDFAINVLGITLGTFGGSALTGWYNKSKTFDLNLWERIENNPSDKYQVPRPGDIIFFRGPTQYGHVACVTIADLGENFFEVINQNTGNGDGRGEDDYIKLETYDYSLVLGWYRSKSYKPLYESIRGISIVNKQQPNTKPRRNGWYNPFNRIITLYPLLYKKDYVGQQSILWHEWTHSVYFDLPGNNILINKPNNSIAGLWDDISNFDSKIVKKINRLAKTNYRENEYINKYAEKSPSEDLSEMIEYYVECKLTGKEYSYKGWLHIKMIFALWIVRKYGDFKL